MMNSYDFEDAEKLVESARAAVPKMAGLIERALDEGAEVIYVNDNFGDWTSSAERLVETVRQSEHARDLVEPLVPEGEHSFVVKARHSCFYETPLEYLLRQKGVGRIVLAGQVTEQCILYSALDAYIRHIDVVVPRDAVAHIHRDLADAALRMMERNMDAEICEAEECVLSSG